MPDNKILPISPSFANFSFKPLLTENPTLFRNWFLAMKKKTLREDLRGVNTKEEEEEEEEEEILLEDLWKENHISYLTS